MVSVPEIALQGVSKRFRGGTLALDAVTCEVHRGEFVSLIGPSGCGKSTLLKIVSGLSSTTEGSVRINGMTPENARELMSFIFQDPTLMPWRTIEENVGLSLDLEHAARPQRSARVAEMLTRVGLAHVAARYPRELSGGMKMRASLARALLSRPRILLMDEPFGALDEITRDHMNNELMRLYEEKKWTVLFVTHSVAEAVFLSTRVLVLEANPGRIAHDVPIDLPWPRNMATRDLEDFEHTVLRISRMLRGVEQA